MEDKKFNRLIDKKILKAYDILKYILKEINSKKKSKQFHICIFVIYSK